MMCSIWNVGLCCGQVGLGTDVAGGYSTSMLDCIRQTMIATNVCGMEPDEKGTKWKPLRCGCACMLASASFAGIIQTRVVASPQQNGVNYGFVKLFRISLSELLCVPSKDYFPTILFYYHVY